MPLLGTQTAKGAEFRHPRDEAAPPWAQAILHRRQSGSGSSPASHWAKTLSNRLPPENFEVEMLGIEAWTLPPGFGARLV